MSTKNYMRPAGLPAMFWFSLGLSSQLGQNSQIKDECRGFLSRHHLRGCDGYLNREETKVKLLSSTTK
jgi:hypothetical protein